MILVRFTLYVLVKSVVPKFLWSVVSSSTMLTYTGENFPPFHRHIKHVEMEIMLPSIIERQKSDSCH